jgi:hypothetical protein
LPAFKKEEKYMCIDGFDYRTAQGLHRDRLAEAESIRKADRAVKAARAAAIERAAAESSRLRRLRQRLGRQLIAIGERLSAA